MSHRDTKMKPIVRNKWGDRFWLFQPNKSQAKTRHNQGDTLGDNESPNLWGKPNKSTRHKGDKAKHKVTKEAKTLETTFSEMIGDKGKQRPSSEANTELHCRWCTLLASALVLGSSWWTAIDSCSNALGGVELKLVKQQIRSSIHELTSGKTYVCFLALSKCNFQIK